MGIWGFRGCFGRCAILLEGDAGFCAVGGAVGFLTVGITALYICSNMPYGNDTCDSSGNTLGRLCGLFHVGYVGGSSLAVAGGFCVLLGANDSGVGNGKLLFCGEVCANTVFGGDGVVGSQVAGETGTSEIVICGNWFNGSRNSSKFGL